MLEFALVVLPFMALVMAVLETSLAYFVQELLETSVETSARNLVTGKTQAADGVGSSGGMTKAQLAERFRLESCKSLPSFLSCNRLFSEVRSAGAWADVDTSKVAFTLDSNGKVTNSFKYDIGSQGSIVMVRLMYLWPVEASGFLHLNNVGSNQRVMFATSVAKSESYQ